MRTSQANRLARWAAMAAAAVTLVSVIAYGWRQWEAEQARQQAPPVVPEPVRQRSEAFSYSKVEGERTLFTIRASQATEYKEGGKSLLQDVWITIYGKTGKRFDNIHTRECDYQPTTGRVVCAGEVQIDLESAEEAGARPGARAIQIRTSGIAFDRELGEASTTQAVEFKFAYGSGRARGMTYSTRQGVARLEKDVEVMLAATRGEAPVRLGGAALEYTRDTRVMRLLGPVTAVQGTRELRAGSLTADFDAAMVAQRLVAAGRATLRDVAPGNEVTLAAETITVPLLGGNIPERVVATGQVAFAAKDAGGDDRLTARQVEMELSSQGRAPRQVRATGAVRVESQTAGGGAVRRLETESLQLDFAAAGRAAERRLERAESLAAATLELRQGEEQTRVRAGKLMAEFDGRSEVRRARGIGGVDVTRRLGRRAEQTTASREFAVEFDARGDWTQAEQSGDVRYREGARSGQAQVARAVRATEMLTLSGGAHLADAVSRTSAAAIEIHQRSGEIAARGGVRTSYSVATQRAGATFVPAFAAQPAHISAEELRANAESGRAVYTGKARMWQGDAVIEADTIELRRGAAEERELYALRNVRGLFPQAATGNAVAGGNPNAKQLWRVKSGQLRFKTSESVVRLEENVRAESGVGQISSQFLDLFLSESQSSGRQLARAEARGAVSVRQGERRGTSDRADYFASEGKFVLSGGKPMLYDAVLGTISGRQLTFFLADDRILVDSEEGSRTVTRHRVEK